MGKEQDLLEAARTGNVVLVERLLTGKRGILGSATGSIPLPSLLSMWKALNVNCTDSSGYTPLHHASLNGHREVVLKLLQFEASSNMADIKGCFPLHLAAWRGDVDIVRILWEGPWRTRMRTMSTSPRQAASMWKALNVNCTDSSGYTPLHHASLNGHREVVLKLLQFEASSNMADIKGCFPLHLAAWRGDVDIVRILVRHGPSHCRVNQQGPAPNGSLELIGRLIFVPAASGFLHPPPPPPPPSPWRRYMTET
ncbi:hypothetical protein CRUP_002846 [Coryphaenoides rupestris]|nr:hypothetical protein CRUP_002846 [Coryphaenoides rupestris]